MSGITYPTTYHLDEEYEAIKKNASEYLSEYLAYPNLITFNDFDRSVTFSTEKLIPSTSTNRPRVMLLFSNAHPYSVYQGMFLSPNTRGVENAFWPVMEYSGWLPISKENRNPKQLADICLKAEYPGPFELIFYCYYAFPTDYPKDLKKIFEGDFFKREIQPEAMEAFWETIQDTSVKAVVTFNKEIFNLVSKELSKRCIDRLMGGELIQSQIKGIDRRIPIFLTFPTGWRFRHDITHARIVSLEKIRTAICSELGVKKSKNP
jgi:hypothetical protein